MVDAILRVNAEVFNSRCLSRHRWCVAANAGEKVGLLRSKRRCGGRDGGSEEAGAVLHGAFGKWEHAGLFNRFAGEGLAFLTTGGYATGVFSVLFAVDPLKEDVEQEVTAKNAKRQKHSD